MVTESEIQKIADQYSSQFKGDFHDNHTESVANNAFIAGYKANSIKYTEEDLRSAMDFVYGWMTPAMGTVFPRPNTLDELKEVFIKLLKK